MSFAAAGERAHRRSLDGGAGSTVLATPSSSSLDVVRVLDATDRLAPHEIYPNRVLGARSRSRTAVFSPPSSSSFDRRHDRRSTTFFLFSALCIVSIVFVGPGPDTEGAVRWVLRSDRNADEEGRRTSVARANPRAEGGSRSVPRPVARRGPPQQRQRRRFPSRGRLTAEQMATGLSSCHQTGVRGGRGFPRRCAGRVLHSGEPREGLGGLRFAAPSASRRR